MKKLLLLTAALLSLTCTQSCKEGQQPTPGPPTLEASINYILADDTQATTFTVKCNGEDVTAKAKIFNSTPSGDVAITTPSFKTKEVGSYQFYAVYGEQTSNKVSVASANMPVDAKPDQFDFKKRVLLTESTGTWCGWCPNAIKALHEFEANPDADDAVIIAAHFNDELSNTKSHKIDAHLNRTGSYPLIMPEMSADSTRFHKLKLDLSAIRHCVDSLKVYGAKTGIAVSSKVVGDKICVRTQIKVSADGAYGIGVLLLEDNIFAQQDNYTEYKEDYFNYHRHVVRDGAPDEDLYEPLGTASATKAGKYTHYTQFNTSGILKTENCRIAVFVFNITDKSADNAIQVAVGTDFPYSYR